MPFSIHEPAEDVRVGHWMVTYSGRKFWPLDPRVGEIHLEDIAAALSKQCRYGGHVKHFYSVAEHCVHVCHAAPKSLKRVALLHDASEAYLVDIPRPVKKMMPEYKVIEERLEEVIALRFGLPYPWPKKVKHLDNSILVDEWKVLATVQNNPGLNLMGDESALGVKIECWSPKEAELNFLHEAHQWL